MLVKGIVMARILDVKNLKKYFEIGTFITRKVAKAVDGVSFHVDQGETFCIVGESGSGKTTIGKMINGLLKPTEGKILYRPSNKFLEKYKGKLEEGKFVDITSLKGALKREIKREIQMIFQDPYGSLDSRLTIGKIIEEGLEANKIGEKEEIKKISMEIMEQVGLIPAEEFYYKYPFQLSGGQRQRVVIARALALRPRFVIADEPVSMLDASVRASILDLMESLKSRLGLTYLFITHDLAVASSICNRIAVLYLGKIVEMGDVRKIIDSPKHPYTIALRESVPDIDRRSLREVKAKGEIPSSLNIPPGCRFHPRCPFVMAECRRKEPMLKVVDDREVACWLY